MDLPDGGAIVAGLVANEEAVGSLVAALCASGLEPSAIRIGAQDIARAQSIATTHGVRADVSADDPLAGAPGLGTEVGHRQRVDRGGVIGAIIGAVIGIVFGFLPLGQFVTASPDRAPLIDGLLFFVAGGISGVVLGGSFGDQLSTHAGFRLIDGMAEGHVTVLVSCAKSQSAAIKTIFENQHAADVVVIG